LALVTKKLMDWSCAVAALAIQASNAAEMAVSGLISVLP
jgi:hypothetical protein